MEFVKTEDGVAVAVYDMNKRGHKTIVMIHGWPLNHKQFEYQIPMLLEHDYRIVRMDLRGFGYSEEAATGYSYTSLAEDVYSAIRELDLYDFILLGFSMGGAVATRYMTRTNGYGVSHLILLDAAVPSFSQTQNNEYGWTHKELNDIWEKMAYDRPAVNEYFGSIFFHNTPSKAAADWFQQLSNLTSGTGQIGGWNSLHHEDLFYELRHIYRPTTIIHGEEDEICKFKAAEIVHHEIKDSVLVPIPSSGHGAFFEQVDAVNKAIAELL